LQSTTTSEKMWLSRLMVSLPGVKRVWFPPHTISDYIRFVLLWT